MPLRLLLLLLPLGFLAPKPTPAPEPRRILVRAPAAFLESPEPERVIAWGSRRGVGIEMGPEDAPAAKGRETADVSVAPASERFQSLARPFPVRFEAGGFTFDGRSYSGPDDAILLTDPSNPRAALIHGNSARAAARLLGRRLFGREGGERPADYEAVSGELSKEGRFARQNGGLAIDRASDRDGIAEREAFFAAMETETRGAVTWEVRDSERAAAAKWQKAVAIADPGKTRGKGKGRPKSEVPGKVRVRVFPDAETKGLYAGSTRPADVSDGGGGVVLVDLDATALDEPDLISPVLAAAALAAARPALLERPTLLQAAGARRAGRWWGREVRSFGAFTRAAGVEPTVEEVVKDAPGISPVLAVGSAASWLDAGARLEGEAAVEKALVGKDADLSAKLASWRAAAQRQTLAPPARRELPGGFLRGVSYAMANAIEHGYVSARSRETLSRLRTSGFGSISVMPFGFAPEASSDRIDFVHRSPRGETDEGTLRAVRDARALGMTAMVKPQIWLAGGGFVGTLAMTGDAAWRDWFASYRRFVVHHAVVAEAAGADLFCVGTELSATEERKNDWKEVIAAVRLATGAPLTYASNWAARAPEIPFWDALDAIGVDFFDPLGKAEKLSDAALEQGARRAAAPLSELSRKLGGKPVLFTEAGFPPVRGAWISPHEEDSGRPASREDAARAVGAVYRALSRETWWKGVYWWKAFSDGRPAAPGEKGFNLIGTAAEKAVLDGFARMK